MKKKIARKLKVIFNTTGLLFVLALVFLGILYFGYIHGKSISYSRTEPAQVSAPAETPAAAIALRPVDKTAYDLRMIALANAPVVPPAAPKKDPKTGAVIPPPAPKPYPWPVKNLPYPDSGAVLPFDRIVAYYGNFYSTQMGVLGQYPEDEMLAKLEDTVKEWQAADPSTPVIPALHYIAVTAQGSPGADGKYRLRMPDSEIDKVITMAAKINALVFLDVQVGKSDVETEVPLLEKYLKMPQVNLGIDPEFSIKTDSRPGKVVGTMDASDINFVANYLATLVRENNLPPKILIVHRFTEAMVTNYQNIKPLPEVQIVMNMDGWGPMAKKINTYKQFIQSEPVQFTGFKLFYKNDVLTPGTTLMTPEQVLQLSPKPIYIQYQ